MILGNRGLRGPQILRHRDFALLWAGMSISLLWAGMSISLLDDGVLLGSHAWHVTR